MAEGEALRQQLHDAIHAILPVYWEDDALSSIWPLIEAAVAAARVATATEIAEAIEARDVGYAEDGYDQGWNDAMRAAAGEARVAGGSVRADVPCALARSEAPRVPAPKGDQ